MPSSLLELFKEVSSAFQKHAAVDKPTPTVAMKPRAAAVHEIWEFVKGQLESQWTLENPGVQAVETDEYGNSWSMCPWYVLDVYLNDKGFFALVTKSDGKLYKLPVTVGKDNAIVTGEETEVFMEALPVTGRQIISVSRSEDGSARWFAAPACTAILNRSGEIDSRALFDSFEAHIMRTGEYPELDFYHMGEKILLGRADWVARDGVAYCASGTFHDTPIARAAIESIEKEQDYWGLSIAYVPTSEPQKIRTSDGAEIPVYNTGVNRFISLLPESDAASILTSISTIEEKKRMNEKVLESFRKLTGDNPELVKQFQMKIDSVNRNAVGMISRDTYAATPSPVTVDPAPVEQREITPEDLTILLESAEFKDAVTGIINDALAAQAQATVDAMTVMQEEQVKENSTMRGLINGVSARLAKAEKTRDAAIKEVLDDMPEKTISRSQVIVRPRNGNRQTVNRSESKDMAAIAESTLSRFSVTQ